MHKLYTTLCQPNNCFLVQSVLEDILLSNYLHLHFMNDVPLQYCQNLHIEDH